MNLNRNSIPVITSNYCWPKFPYVYSEGTRIEMLQRHNDVAIKGTIDYFTVTSLVAWPLNESEAGGDRV